MPEKADRTQASFARASTVRRRRTKFQEASRHAGDNAVHASFLKGAGVQRANVATALSSADGMVRARVIHRLQQERGNAYVQRVVAAVRSTSPMVQLDAVFGELPCGMSACVQRHSSVAPDEATCEGCSHNFALKAGDPDAPAGGG